MADGREAGVRLVFVGLTQRANTSAFGGASVVIANLKKELVRMGMSVDVLVFARRDVTMLPVALDSRVNLQFLRGHSQGVLFIQVVGYLVWARPRRGPRRHARRHRCTGFGGVGGWRGPGGECR